MDPSDYVVADANDVRQAMGEMCPAARALNGKLPRLVGPEVCESLDGLPSLLFRDVANGGVMHSFEVPPGALPTREDFDRFVGQCVRQIHSAHN